MTAHGPLLVTCRLASPLAGDPPHLDALLEKAAMGHLASIEEQLGLRQTVRGADGRLLRMELTRDVPLPRAGETEAAYLGRMAAAFPGGDPEFVRRNGECFWDWMASRHKIIPLAFRDVAGWKIAHCSAPILPKCLDTVEHVTKQLAVELAGLIREDQRRVIDTASGPFKSYRLPLRVRRVACVRWFCIGDRYEVRKALKAVRSLGKKMADGYGRVARWEVEPTADDRSWFVPHEMGAVLMRALPLGDHLPQDLVGFRRDYMAVVPPYWHPDRRCEGVTPT